MSIFWNIHSEKSYRNKILTKWKPFEKLSYKYYPTPGCISHARIVGDRRGENLFRGFVDRPQKASHLYWRSHPEEYTKLMESFKK